MTRVMVTGATTPIGRQLASELAARDDVEAVVAVGRPGDAHPLAEVEGLSYVEVDLTRSRAVRGLLYGQRDGVNVVVHGAAHRRSRGLGPRAHRLNVEATRTLLSVCETHPTVNKFIYPSSAAVYRVDARLPAMIDEHQPLNLAPRAPQWVRDRVEADLTVCARMGLSDMQVMVLRLSECLAPDVGSQLHDYLDSAVCFRPLGFDPVINVISIDDTVAALQAAVVADGMGVFNIPGYDTLALSMLIARWGRNAIPAPGFLLAPLYGLRAKLLGREFRYDMNAWRFHYNGVLDGRHAQDKLGYTPTRGIEWPL